MPLGLNTGRLTTPGTSPFAFFAQTYERIGPFNVACTELPVEDRHRSLVLHENGPLSCVLLVGGLIRMFRSKL